MRDRLLERGCASGFGSRIGLLEYGVGGDLRI